MQVAPVHEPSGLIEKVADEVTSPSETPDVSKACAVYDMAPLGGKVVDAGVTTRWSRAAAPTVLSAEVEVEEKSAPASAEPNKAPAKMPPAIASFINQLRRRWARSMNYEDQLRDDGPGDVVSHLDPATQDAVEPLWEDWTA